MAKEKAAKVCKKKIQLDVSGSVFHYVELIYLGAHMVNDPMLNIPKDEKDKHEFNAKIGYNLALVAKRVFEIRGEFHVNYQYD